MILNNDGIRARIPTSLNERSGTRPGFRERTPLPKSGFTAGRSPDVVRIVVLVAAASFGVFEALVLAGLLVIGGCPWG